MLGPTKPARETSDVVLEEVNVEFISSFQPILEILNQFKTD